jgi:putative peptidoglycan lipid II flippase
MAGSPEASAVSGAGDGDGPTTAAGDGGSGLLRSSAVVAVGTMLSRVTGLIRTIVTAYALGNFGAAAAYNLANNTPNMIYDLLLGGVLSATLVPTFIANREQKRDEGNDAVLTIATVALTAITLLAVLLAPVIIHGYVLISGAGTAKPSADEEALAVSLLRLFAPQVLFYGLTTLATAYLNARRRFAAAAFAPVLNNVWMFFILIAAARAVEGKTVAEIAADSSIVVLLGLGTTAGIAAMALSLWPAIVRSGPRPVWRFAPKDPAVKRVARLSSWTFGYVVANQVTLFIILGLAGTGVSAWAYAYQFFQLPYGVVTVSIMTAFTPELATLTGPERREAFNQTFFQGLRLICLVLLPATVLFVALARQIVWVLFVRGRFTEADVPITASTLAGLAWGIVGFSVYLYDFRAFYALGDTKTPFIINMIQNVLTLVLALLLGSEWGLAQGVEGLALAWSFAYLAAALLALVALRRRTGPFGVKTAVATTRPVARMVVATVPTAIALAVVVRVLPQTGAGAWLTIILGSVVGGGLYVALLLALGVREVRDVPRLLLKRP